MRASTSPATRCGSQLYEMVNQALEPVRDYYSYIENGKRVRKPFAEWLDGWARVIRDFDGYSMGRFLREYAGFSDEAIEAIGTIENMTSRLHLSFFHTFLGRSDINPDATYWEIEGGSWQLPYALADELQDELEMGERMIRMEYWDPRRDGGAGQDVGPNGPQVAVHTVPEGDPEAEPTVWKGDFAIVTVPFSALRFVQVSPPYSYKKRRAIIETHYDQATKVLLEFSRRWWEFTEADWKDELDSIEPGLYEYYQRAGEEDAEAAALAANNGHRPPPNLPRVLLGAHRSVDSSRISQEQLEVFRHTPLRRASVRPATNCFGGGSTTDNPNRFMYYPSHPVPDSDGGGVVLASYSWSDDAVRWDSMADAERYVYALRNLQSVHGRMDRGVLHRLWPDPELAARPVRLRRGGGVHPAPDDQLPPRRGQAGGPGALHAASTSRSSTPGSRARWRPPSARRSPCTRHPHHHPAPNRRSIQRCGPDAHAERRC